MLYMVTIWDELVAIGCTIITANVYPDFGNTDQICIADMHHYTIQVLRLKMLDSDPSLCPRKIAPIH